MGNYIDFRKSSIQFANHCPIAFAILAKIKICQNDFGYDFKPKGLVIEEKLFIQLLHSSKDFFKDNEFYTISNTDLFDKKRYIEIGGHKLIAIPSKDLNSGEAYIF